MRALGGFGAGAVVVVAAAGVVVAAAEVGTAVVGGEDVDVDGAGELLEKRGGAYVELVVEAALVVAVAELKKLPLGDNALRESEYGQLFQTG